MGTLVDKSSAHVPILILFGTSARIALDIFNAHTCTCTPARTPARTRARARARTHARMRAHQRICNRSCHVCTHARTRLHACRHTCLFTRLYTCLNADLPSSATLTATLAVRLKNAPPVGVIGDVSYFLLPYAKNIIKPFGRNACVKIILKCHRKDTANS